MENINRRRFFKITGAAGALIAVPVGAVAKYTSKQNLTDSVWSITTPTEHLSIGLQNATSQDIGDWVAQMTEEWPGALVNMQMLVGAPDK